MTDRPIIFSDPMVAALIRGSKTQTRRLASSPLRRCEVGDRLYVREAFSAIFWDPEDIDGPAREFWATPKIERTADLCSGRFYRTDEDCKPHGERFIPEGQWTPSIHMPRWASRLTLAVDGARIEPLQSIVRADAIAEGLSLASSIIEEFWRWPAPHDAGHWLSPPAAYKWLWDQLHSAEGERWQDNPDVVVVTFRVVHGNIDHVSAMGQQK